MRKCDDSLHQTDIRFRPHHSGSTMTIYLVISQSLLLHWIPSLTSSDSYPTIWHKYEIFTTKDYRCDGTVDCRQWQAALAMSAAVCGLQVCALLTLARHNYRDGGAGPWFLVPRCGDTSLFWRSCPATAAPPSPRVLYTGANTQVLPFLFLAHSVRHNFLQRTEKEGP